MLAVTEMREPDRRTDKPGIYRSPEGFLINKDNDALKAYKIQMQKAREAVSLREEVLELKKDMEEIKKLLRGLVK